MAVQLGTPGQPDFTQPIELMMDCHRRIEHFLDVLIKVAAQQGRGELTDEGRRALHAALDYFRHAAPRHIADEEQSLFPRMRQIDTPPLRDALAEMARLESDHRQVETAHQRIDAIGRNWLEHGRLDEAACDELTGLLRQLAASYAEHIQLEDQRVFALASQTLDAASLQAIGWEMKQRRSDQPSLVRMDLRAFTRAVASKVTMPASGCVLALVAALSAALTEMVVALARVDNSDRDDTMAALSRSRDALVHAVDRDAQAFRAFQAARKQGRAPAAGEPGINDVPCEVAVECLATIKQLHRWAPHARAVMHAEVYAASALALTIVDISRFTLAANVPLTAGDDDKRLLRQVDAIHREAAALHAQVVAMLV
jgi:hemerythrin-like domain-containing protein/formiminotetrahydrofolate cyclodeaminase